MTTETTDPLEQAVMEAAAYACSCCPTCVTDSPRLRLHVRLALAKAYRDGLDAANRTSAYWQIINKLTAAHTEIAALEARLQEE